MTLFERISAIGREQQIEFLLIGGHAVNLCGYSRPTVDIDLLVRRSDEGKWKEIFRAMGLGIFREGPTFVQFVGASEANIPPIDLMIVSDETFKRLRCDARTHDYLGAQLPVPAPKHLIALKLHVLKQD